MQVKQIMSNVDTDVVIFIDMLTKIVPRIGRKNSYVILQAYNLVDKKKKDRLNLLEGSRVYIKPDYRLDKEKIVKIIIRK